MQGPALAGPGAKRPCCLDFSKLHTSQDTTKPLEEEAVLKRRGLCSAYYNLWPHPKILAKSLPMSMALTSCHSLKPQTYPLFFVLLSPIKIALKIER